MDKTVYEGIEKQLGLGEKCADAVSRLRQIADWLAKDDAPTLSKVRCERPAAASCGSFKCG